MSQEFALFEGMDAANQVGLWVTNGTAAGTYELIGIGGANLAGLNPFGMTVFNGEMLFNGADAAGQFGLWVSNGTAAGTYELTGISGANAAGVVPFEMTVFNADVLFSGYDAAGDTGLWVTDGTAAGTHELTGISGANAAGLNPSDMVVFNGEVLFNGLDTAGDASLWVTNATAAGTHELTGISGANAAGLNPSDITAFNGEVLFNGVDTVGDAGLWVTNGTAAGTFEFTGISGANAAGLNPSDMTVFNGEVLFNGTDTADHAGLWVTNGTAAGTHELTGISGANAAGLNPSDMRVLNGEVLFNGVDTAGDAELWVTNGTVTGTHELTGIGGANAAGLNPSDMTVFNGEVLFNGTDAAGNVGLWVTNGTVAGTYELSNIPGENTGGLNPEAIAAATPTDPVLNVSSFTIGVQQSVPVSSFFTITNPTGDSITEYSFEDNGGGSGHFTVGGSVEFFSGQPFTITANNLSSVEYVGGVSAGTDTITLDAYDATAGAWLPAVSLNAVTMAPFPLVNASDVTEGVYIGYFGRAGDPGGDSYWLNQLASGKISETGMATSFSAQPEAIAEYPFLANPSTATQAQIGSFIDAVYEDLFDRLPDSGGLAYWQNVLTTNLGNPQGVGAFILNVISGAQDIDQTTISNKVTVADYFTQELSSDGISFSSSADSLAHSAIASVTSDHSTVLAAESTINIFVAAQSAGAQVALVGASHTDLVSPVN